MKYIITVLCILPLLVFANSNKESKETLKNEHLQKQLEKERKYAKEQRFYSKEEYDLKSHEVDMESVKNLPDVPDYNKDFDMDHVYD